MRNLLVLCGCYLAVAFSRALPVEDLGLNPDAEEVPQPNQNIPTGQGRGLAGTGGVIVIRPMQQPGFFSFPDLPSFPSFIRPPTFFYGNDRGMVNDTNATTFDAISPSADGGIWNMMNDMMRDLQQQMYNWRKTMFEGSVEDISGEDDFNPFGNFPPNYKNSTFSTKNVNGTLVSVNETIQKHNNNGSHSFFHVKVINIRPSILPDIFRVNSTTERTREILGGNDEDNDLIPNNNAPPSETPKVTVV